MRLACVVGAYPCASETFVERELAALEAWGHEVVVFPLWRAKCDKAATPPGRQVERCSRWSPWGELAAMGASIRWQCYFLGQWRREGPAAWRVLVHRGLAFDMVRRMKRLGIERVHAQFGNAPSTFGWLAADVAGLRFSFAVHARDVFVEAEFFAAKARAADSHAVHVVRKVTGHVVRSESHDDGRGALLGPAETHRDDAVDLEQRGRVSTAHLGRARPFVGRLRRSTPQQAVEQAHSVTPRAASTLAERLMSVVFSLPAKSRPTSRPPASSTAEPLSPPWLMGPAMSWSTKVATRPPP